jgi:predicted type IV restriction endonuclease
MGIDITKDLKKYLPIFQEAFDQGMNESDTSLRISKFCENVLGYDVFKEVSREHAVKERNVDYAIRCNEKVQFFIEVKQAGTALKEKHIEQASNYAANAGVRWVLLTNGKNWNMYHLSFDEGIQIDMAWSVDILEGDIKDSVAKLSMLHRKNVTKGALDEYYERLKILSPRSILQTIFHESTLRLIGAHLRRSYGAKIDEQELVENIKNMISKETWEEIGDVKIIRAKKPSKPKQKQPIIPVLVPQEENKAENM